MQFLDGLNNVKEPKCKKNNKPKVKLKIDAVRKSNEQESCKENEEMKNLMNDTIESKNEKADGDHDVQDGTKNNDDGDGNDTDDVNDDDDDDDKEEDFKDDKNVDKTNGLQSLFM